MMHSHTRLAIGIGIGILAFSFFFSAPRTRDVIEETAPVVTPVAFTVSAQDVFKKGVHTITGSIEAPNACATVRAEAFYEGAETIRLAITMTPYEGTCLQLPTRMRFSTSVSAPAKTPLIATVNDAPAVLETP
jgi:hypothetical protein